MLNRKHVPLTMDGAAIYLHGHFLPNQRPTPNPIAYLECLVVNRRVALSGEDGATRRLYARSREALFPQEDAALDAGGDDVNACGGGL
jgi:hypothetical protein